MMFEKPNNAETLMSNAIAKLIACIASSDKSVINREPSPVPNTRL